MLPRQGHETRGVLSPRNSHDPERETYVHSLASDKMPQKNADSGALLPQKWEKVLEAPLVRAKCQKKVPRSRKE